MAKAKLKSVRVGIVGVGNMGSSHANMLLAGKVRRCKLVAVADHDPAKLEKYSEKIQKFSEGADLIKKADVDAVIVATPHYSHTTLGAAALKKGLHVLVEKPISVHKADCEKLIAAHKKRNQVFAAMFNQRTDPHYQKVKQLIETGKLGELVRVNWIITNWFRSEEYYASGGWRATWAGEGGGVLVNQCPHQLDLIQWLCGMPIKVRGFCDLGKRHHIEVEDEVTAVMKYKNGATGVFITSTGEAPGTNRLEICGELGKIIVENGDITFTQNAESSSKFCKTSKKSFAMPKRTIKNIPVKGGGLQHLAIVRNFVSAILDGKPLIAPAKEGIKSVELANAMLYSSLLNKELDLPINGKAYERKLKELIKGSNIVKKAVKSTGNADMGSSFNTQ